MPIYQTIVRKVEASQYRQNQLKELPAGVKFRQLGTPFPVPCCVSNHGIILVEDGDFIVLEIDGTYYPVPEEVFKKKYERAGVAP